MSAALELTPELQAAIDAAAARAVAQLALVDPDAGLSMLAASKRRRECERRQADALRGDRSPEGLSLIPSTIRKRECKRRQAAATKARSIPDRSPSLDLQPVRTERATAGGVLRTDRIATGGHAAVPTPTGPLAGDVATLVDRASGYAESTRKRARAWLFEEATRIFREELGLRLPERWSGPKDWGAAKVLVRDWPREQLLEAIKTTCGRWKLSPTWSRPTLGLVLYHLRQKPPVAAPRPDPRRLTGEQLEQRDRSRAVAAQRKIPEPQPPRPPTASASTDSAGTPPCKGELQEAAARPAGSDGCAAGTSPAPPGPLQLAEPSPTSSPEARAVLEFVNATAAKCRAFRGRP